MIIPKRGAWILVLLVGGFDLLAWSQTSITPKGEAQNVRFEQAGGGVVQILYDLIASDPRAVFDVTLDVSQDAGATFQLRPRSVTGDVGPGVGPGPAKRIMWDSGKDVERLVTDQFRFRIVATARPLQPEPKVPAADPTQVVRTGSLAVITSS